MTANAGPAHADPAAPSCRRCGGVGPAGSGAAVVAGWMPERDPDGRAGWLCPSCVRRHVRDIEARLDPDWW